ncbi:MAG: GGDEF domain-containing protein [Ignavibacteriae bacterium]|nr:GGDEF domain-containing protein [Ignavibacteriota bacterium]
MAELIWKKIRSVQGGIALALLLTLIIGLFLGSPVGRIVCGMGLLALVGYFVFVFFREGVFDAATQRGKRLAETIAREEHVPTGQGEVYSQPEGDMKKLLFDDFQPASSAGYVVKEIDQEQTVIPSTKTAQRAPTTREEKVKEFEIADFFDLESDIFRNESEPRSEFNFLLNKLLIAVKEVLFAHSVAFFWANRQKQQMVLEAKATDSANFMLTKRYPIEQDIASQVAKSGKPQVLGRISALAEKELVRHYVVGESVKSLIVVPVFYVVGEKTEEALPEGVIVADSKAEDAFGTETLSLMGQFTKVISALIKSYTNKYDLLLDSELLSSIRRLQDRVKSERSEQAVLDAMTDEAVKLMNWDVLSVVMFSEEQNRWAIQRIVNRANAIYPSASSVVDFEASLVGKSISTNTLVQEDDLEANPAIRFGSDEVIGLKGSFISVPISSLNRCYGALTVESGNKYQFSPAEAETLYRLVENAAEMLEVLYMNDLVKEFIAVDQITGSLNKKHFGKKLEEEVSRAEDFGTELSLVSMSIDGMQEMINRHGKDGFDGILNQVAKLIRVNVQPYDVIGRIDSNTLSVLLISTTANDAYLWAEKVRKHIASNIISIAGMNCSVTVSAGVAGLSDGMSKDELVSSTSQVLLKAVESGGNLVRVY